MVIYLSLLLFTLYILAGGIFVWFLREHRVPKHFEDFAEKMWEETGEEWGWLTRFVEIFLRPNPRAGLLWPVPLIVFVVTFLVLSVSLSIRWVLNGFSSIDT